MPNWCENDLTVEGPKEAIEEFIKFAAGESPFDFNKVIPYPEEFKRLDDAAKAWDREHAGMPHEERGTPPKDGFNSGGYKWRVEHWGTKWPAFHVDIEEPVPMYGGTVEVGFHFDTAWSPPTPVIAKAAERFPALTFELRYFECGDCFNGLFRCDGGAVVTDKSGEYFGDRGG